MESRERGDRKYRAGVREFAAACATGKMGVILSSSVNDDVARELATRK